MTTIAGAFLRFIACGAVGGTAAILVAANWPNPDDQLAGIAIGMTGTYAGLIAGGIWSFAYMNRKDQYRG